jgi:2'-5' RNA ligase
MAAKIIFNLGLLPEASFSKKLVDCSQALKVTKNSVYSLNEKSLPHITILMFEGSEDKGKEIWAKVKHLAEKPFTLSFRGLAIDRWRDWDCVWLRVVRSRELEKLQADALSALSLFELSFVNGVGDLFDPHATLSAWPLQSECPAIPLDTVPFGASNVQARLTLGKSGPTYQYAEKLFL